MRRGHLWTAWTGSQRPFFFIYSANTFDWEEAGQWRSLSGAALCGLVVAESGKSFALFFNCEARRLAGELPTFHPQQRSHQIGCLATPASSPTRPDALRRKAAAFFHSGTMSSCRNGSERTLRWTPVGLRLVEMFMSPPSRTLSGLALIRRLNLNGGNGSPLVLQSLDVDPRPPGGHGPPGGRGSSLWTWWTWWTPSHSYLLTAAVP